MLPWKLRKRHILPVNQNLSSVYFSLAKFHFVSCNLSIAMIWQITYSQTAKTVFSHLKSWHVKEEGIQGRDDRSSGCGIVVQKEPYCGIRVPYPGRP